MQPAPKTMLEANALIHTYGPAAEEFAAGRLWDCRQKGDKQEETRWMALLEALKHVRELRDKTS